MMPLPFHNRISTGATPVNDRILVLKRRMILGRAEELESIAKELRDIVADSRLSDRDMTEAANFLIALL